MLGPIDMQLAPMHDEDVLQGSPSSHGIPVWFGALHMPDMKSQPGDVHGLLSSTQTLVDCMHWPAEH